MRGVTSIRRRLAGTSSYFSNASVGKILWVTLSSSSAWDGSGFLGADWPKARGAIANETTQGKNPAGNNLEMFIAKEYVCMLAFLDQRKRLHAMRGALVDKKSPCG